MQMLVGGEAHRFHRLFDSRGPRALEERHLRPRVAAAQFRGDEDRADVADAVDMAAQEQAAQRIADQQDVRMLLEVAGVSGIEQGAPGFLQGFAGHVLRIQAAGGG